MDSVCLNVGGFTLPWFGVMMASGFLAALLNWVWIGSKAGRDFNYCSDLLFWIMVSGILGARLAYVVSEIDVFIKHPASIVRLDQGGLIYYGGFAGAGIALYIFARAKKESFFSLLDFVAVSLPLAHAFGRIGCFLHGCCSGREYHGFFSVSFPANSPPWFMDVDAGRISAGTPHSLPVHPVQLYESAFNIALYVLLVLVFRRTKKSGTVIATYLLAYPVGRFLFEFLRGDERMLFLGINVAQALSLALFVTGAVIMMYSRRSANETGSAAGREIPKA